MRKHKHIHDDKDATTHQCDALNRQPFRHLQESVAFWSRAPLGALATIFYCCWRPADASLPRRGHERRDDELERARPPPATPSLIGSRLVQSTAMSCNGCFDLWAAGPPPPGALLYILRRTIHTIFPINAHPTQTAHLSAERVAIAADQLANVWLCGVGGSAPRPGVNGHHAGPTTHSPPGSPHTCNRTPHCLLACTHRRYVLTSMLTHGRTANACALAPYESRGPSQRGLRADLAATSPEGLVASFSAALVTATDP